MAQPHAVQLALIGSRFAPVCPSNVSLPGIIAEREAREEGAKVLLLSKPVNPKATSATAGGGHSTHHHHGRGRKSSSLDKRNNHIASVSSLSSSPPLDKRNLSSSSNNNSSSDNDSSNSGDDFSVERLAVAGSPAKAPNKLTSEVTPSPSANVHLPVAREQGEQSITSPSPVEEKEAPARPHRHLHRRSLSTSEHLHFATKAPPTLSAAAFQPREDSDDEDETPQSSAGDINGNPERSRRVPVSSSSSGEDDDNDVSSVIKVNSVNGENEVQDELNSTVSSVRSVIFVPQDHDQRQQLEQQQESGNGVKPAPSALAVAKGPVSRVISAETGSKVGSPTNSLRVGANSPNRRPRRSSAPDLDSIVESVVTEDIEDPIPSPPKSTESARHGQVRGSTPLNSDRSGGGDSTKSNRSRRHFRQYSAPVIGGGVDAVGEDALSAAIAELKLPDGLVITKSGISSNASTPDRSLLHKRSPLLHIGSNFRLERTDDEESQGAATLAGPTLKSPASVASLRSADGTVATATPPLPGTGMFNPGELEMLEHLGRGSAGRVSKALHVSALRIVAVKAIQRFDAAKVETTIAEIRALYKRMIPFTSVENGDDNVEEGSCILGFYDAFIEEGRGEVNLVLEFMDGGSLQDLVDRKNAMGQTLSEDFISVVCRRILKGLCELYEDRLLHRDMKPANVLLSRSGAVKLSDFGVSVAFGRGENSNAKTYVGTVGFMAPERVTGKGAESVGYSYASDLYGVGLIAYVCATGNLPFKDEYAQGGIFGVFVAIEEEETPKLDPAKFSPELVDFVAQCLRFKPEDRPTAFEHLNHPFVKKFAEQPDLAHKVVVDQLGPVDQQAARAELNRLLNLAATHHVRSAAKHDVAVYQFTTARLKSLSKQLGVVFADEQRELEELTSSINERMVRESGAAVLALAGTASSPSSMTSSQTLSPRMATSAANPWRKSNLKLELPK